MRPTDQSGLVIAVTVIIVSLHVCIAGEVLESNGNLKSESMSPKYVVKLFHRYLYVPLLSLLFLDIQFRYWFVPRSHHFDDEDLQEQKMYVEMSSTSAKAYFTWICKLHFGN